MHLSKWHVLLIVVLALAVLAWFAFGLSGHARL